MIKADEGKMHIEGTGIQIRAEFCCIVKEYYNSVLKGKLGMSEEDATNRIHEDVGIALKTEEELKNEAEAASKKLLKVLGGCD